MIKSSPGHKSEFVYVRFLLEHPMLTRFVVFPPQDTIDWSGSPIIKNSPGHKSEFVYVRFLLEHPMLTRFVVFSPGHNRLVRVTNN